MEGMTRVDAAEKEASEVLHSLLSVERIEKPEQVILVTTAGTGSTQDQGAFQGTPNQSTDGRDSQVQWHTPVSIATQSLFTAINETNNHFPSTIDEQQVVVSTPALFHNTSFAEVCNNSYIRNSL